MGSYSSTALVRAFRGVVTACAALAVAHATTYCAVEEALGCSHEQAEHLGAAEAGPSHEPHGAHEHSRDSHHPECCVNFRGIVPIDAVQPALAGADAPSFSVLAVLPPTGTNERPAAVLLHNHGPPGHGYRFLFLHFSIGSRAPPSPA